MMLKYFMLILNYGSLKVTIFFVFLQNAKYVRGNSANTNTGTFHHTGSNRIQPFPFAATNEPLKKHGFLKSSIKDIY